MANHSTVRDTGAFFTIVPETREVQVPSTHKVIGVVGDHLAEQLTFEIPKYIDSHDIRGCARRYVEWENVEGERGSDQLVELTELPEGAQPEMLYFTWTIRDRLAAAKGLVQFSVHFEDVDTNGLRLYHWGTTTCKICEIRDSINHTLGKYAAIWVAGDTLVIEDYTPVEGGALALETPGIVPEGTLEINAVGTYDVGKYAAAEVVLNAEDYPDLVPENIVKGKNVLGVIGTLEITPARIFVNTTAPGPVRPVANVWYTTAEAFTLSAATDTFDSSSGYRGYVNTCVGGIIVLSGFNGSTWTFDENSSKGVQKLYGGGQNKDLAVKVTAAEGQLVASYTDIYA